MAEEHANDIPVDTDAIAGMAGDGKVAEKGFTITMLSAVCIVLAGCVSNRIAGALDFLEWSFSGGRYGTEWRFLPGETILSDTNQVYSLEFNPAKARPHELLLKIMNPDRHALEEYRKEFGCKRRENLEGACVRVVITHIGDGRKIEKEICNPKGSMPLEGTIWYHCIAVLQFDASRLPWH